MHHYLVDVSALATVAAIVAETQPARAQVQVLELPPPPAPAPAPPPLPLLRPLLLLLLPQVELQHVQAPHLPPPSLQASPSPTAAVRPSCPSKP